MLFDKSHYEFGEILAEFNMKYITGALSVNNVKPIGKNSK